MKQEAYVPDAAPLKHRLTQWLREWMEDEEDLLDPAELYGDDSAPTRDNRGPKKRA